MTEQTNTPELRFPEFRDKWSIYKLFEVLKSKTEGMKRGPFGGALKKELFVGDGYAVYEQRNAIYDNQDFRYFIDENKYKEMILFSVLPGDIIMSCSGTIGRLSLIPNNYREGVINQALIRFRTNNAVFNNYFIIYMRSMYMQRKMLEINPGSAITNLIPVKELKLLDFPLPSLDEQEKISDFFSKLDQQIELEEEKLELLEQQKRGYMQKIFSQEIRFKDEYGELYPKWRQKKIGELAQIVRGASPRPIKDPKWFDINSDIGWLRIADVTEQNGKINFLEQRLSKEGQSKTRVLKSTHLLLSIAASVGKPVINFVKTGVHDGFLIFLNPQFNIYYMYNWLDFFKKVWNKYGQPGSQVNLNSDIVKSQEIRIPHINEQNKIADFLESIDKLVIKQSNKVELLKQRKKGLLQKMFV